MAALDWIKAAAIAAVVLNHAGRWPWVKVYPSWELWLCHTLTLFHVPAFLFVSGFLYAQRDAIDAGTFRRRLARLLVPYTLATLVVVGLGLRNWREAPWLWLTGSALAPYYFVFALALCIGLSWPLSRLSHRGRLVLLLVLGTAVVATSYDLELIPSRNTLWRPRDPVTLFYFGYFTLGWIVAEHRRPLRAFATRHRRLLLGFVAVGVASWVVYALERNFHFRTPARIVYTLSVVGAIALLATRPHPWVRFLSDASMTIFLYHRLFQIALEPTVFTWPSLPRLVVIFATGMAGSVLLVAVGRRILGSHRSRLLLGA